MTQITIVYVYCPESWMQNTAIVHIEIENGKITEIGKPTSGGEVFKKAQQKVIASMRLMKTIPLKLEFEIDSKNRVFLRGQKKPKIAPMKVKFLSAHRNALTALLDQLRKDNEDALEEYGARVEANAGFDPDDNARLETEEAIRDTFTIVQSAIQKLR